MSDYDNRTIPILDDIIETPVTGNKTVSDDTAAADGVTGSATESSPEVFPDTSGESDEIEPQIGIIDDFDDDSDIEAQQIVFSATTITVLDDAISDDTEVEQDLDEEERQTLESALIDYHRAAEGEQTALNDSLLSPADADLEATTSVIDIEQITVLEPSTDETSELTDATADQLPDGTADEAVSVESVVDDIVRQLLPDLEQQLRFLVLQALEDRLSDTALDKLTKKRSVPE
jgi:hypothetical protein